jgi:hypothetical protein
MENTLKGYQVNTSTFKTLSQWEMMFENVAKFRNAKTGKVVSFFAIKEIIIAVHHNDDNPNSTIELVKPISLRGDGLQRTMYQLKKQGFKIEMLTH